MKSRIPFKPSNELPIPPSLWCLSCTSSRMLPFSQFVSSQFSILLLSVIVSHTHAHFLTRPVTRAEIVGSAQVTATVFWSKLFGERAAKGLTILPVLSAASNILMVIIGHSRSIREIGRQGILPYPKFWVYTWPFGTPTGALAAIYVISLIVVLAAPAGDAFSFLTSMGNYPSSFFDALLAVGLFMVRRHRKQLGLPSGEYRSWTFVVVFFIASKVFMLVMPWIPPPGGINGGAFSFFYASSSITGMGM